MSEKINVENTTSSPVLVSIRNHTGVIELNRPRALNSLNPEMLDIIRQALSQWRHNDEVEQVLVYSNSPKAFCAGGDVRAARDGVLAEKWAEVDEFFEGEYALNGDIAEYPKPYIAVIDGVAMGGGLGISAHGSHRVVTEKAFASMPEMAIGYVTDVGIAYMSQRMVGTRGEADPALAKFWGLSGYRMYAADMLWSGLATHVVNDADAFIEDVIADGVDAAIEKHAVEPEGQPELAGLIKTSTRYSNTQRGKRSQPRCHNIRNSQNSSPNLPRRRALRLWSQRPSFSKPKPMPLTFARRCVWN